MGTVGGKARHEFLLGQAPPHVIDRFAEGADMIVLDTMHILPVELRDYLAILLALNRYGVKYPNIGAMQVTEEIFSHVGGVFHALMLNWAYMPAEKDLEAYRAIYRGAYGEEMLQIFENALLYNRKHEQYIFPFERIGQGSRVVLYGAGNVGKSYYRQIKDYEGIKLVGWVDAARREAYEGCGVSGPDALSGWDYDYLVIAVWQEDVAKQIRGSLLSAGVAEEKIIWVQQG